MSSIFDNYYITTIKLIDNVIICLYDLTISGNYGLYNG